MHHKRPPAPLYKSAWTRGLRQRVFACSRAISFGPADRHSYTATGLSGGHDGWTTPVLGGSLHQFWLWHPPSGPIASGDEVNALVSWAIRFCPEGQEDGTVLRGSRFGHLQAGSPLSDRRWRGLLVKALGTGGAPFNVDTDRLTHSRVVTPGAPFKGHLAILFLSL